MSASDELREAQKWLKRNTSWPSAAINVESVDRLVHQLQTALAILGETDCALKAAQKTIVRLNNMMWDAAEAAEDAGRPEGESPAKSIKALAEAQDYLCLNHVAGAMHEGVDCIACWEKEQAEQAAAAEKESWEFGVHEAAQYIESYDPTEQGPPAFAAVTAALEKRLTAQERIGEVVAQKGPHATETIWIIYDERGHLDSDNAAILLTCDSLQEVYEARQDFSAESAVFQYECKDGVAIGTAYLGRLGDAWSK